jgi:hypothetical protein
MGPISTLADISTMWLLFLTLIAIVPFGVIFYFIIKGLNRLRQLEKQYLPIAQDKVRQVAAATEQVSLKVAEPVVRAHAVRAQLNTITRTALRRNNS